MKKWVLCTLWLSATVGAVNLPSPRSTVSDGLTPTEIPAPLEQIWTNKLVGRYLPSAKTSNGLPPPHSAFHSKKLLTLEDAILLALRNNPDVISAQMTRVIDKYNFELAEEKLTPTFTLADFSATAQKGAKPAYGSFNPSMKWNTLYGTSVSVHYNHSVGTGGAGGGDISITQPLLSGLHDNKWDYMNAEDQVKLNKMTYYSNVLTVVNTVVNGYLSMIQSVMNNQIQQENFRQQKQQYEFARLRLKAGQISKSDFRQQKSSFVSSKLSFSKQKDAQEQQYYNFIQMLGLSLQSKLNIPSHLMGRFSSMTLPSFSQAVKIMLRENITYNKALINMYSEQRRIERARDKLNWGLGVTLSDGFGQSLSSTGTPKGRSAKLTLHIPIDNRPDKIALMQERIQYELAKLSLQKTKREQIINLRNDYNAVGHDKDQLELSKESEQVKQEVLQDTELKYKFGKTTAFELGVVQQDLLAAQQAYVQAKVTYFLDVFKVHQDMGDALAFWHISLRY